MTFGVEELIVGRNTSLAAYACGYLFWPSFAL